MKKVFLSLVLMGSMQAFAVEGPTPFSYIARMEIVRNEGVMVFGNFGNPAACTSFTDRFFVAIGHPQFQQIYAALLVAMSSGKQVSAYVDQCIPVTWFSAPTDKFNVLSPAGSIQVQ